MLNHTLGFPRIGVQRELKKALESYWDKQIDQQQLIATGKMLRERHWSLQKEAGIDLIPVGDFAWYDQVLTTSLLLGNIPERHRNEDGTVDLDTLFRMARGRAPTGKATTASEMTKWFNTNYHYIVPEFTRHQSFTLCWRQLFEEIDEAKALGFNIKPVLLGPISYLWLGKVKGETFDKLTLLPQLITVYQDILAELHQRNIEWLQIDEPIFVLDLPKAWLAAYQQAYQALTGQTKLLLTTYFGAISHHLSTIKSLPVDGLHIDAVAGNDHWQQLDQHLPAHWLLSLGIINGRNVWRTDLADCYQRIIQFNTTRPLWLGSSCSLLHSPIDLNHEQKLDDEVKSWFAFAYQKCEELAQLTQAINQKEKKKLDQLSLYSAPLQARKSSNRVHNPLVKQQLSAITTDDYHRASPYPQRAKIQRNYYLLPLLPTTTIGSFPQTTDIRQLRLAFKSQQIDFNHYQTNIQQHIKQVIDEQEKLGLDVLVHGEAERNDMVEYFGENLAGFIFSQQGWVQSYGSRCVKPPIIIGDISRPHPITVDWSCYAQSLTHRPVKGMLTGPMTILCWSFPREDISRETIAKQLALALRDEVRDLEKAGITIIQIDEPALREGLPLRQCEWQAYLTWAVEAFRLTASVAADQTQIHTHMCYSEFNDIIASIAALDADVITIETSRSDMELLEVFESYTYPNEIGPGVYDIHTPNVPTIDAIVNLLRKAAHYIPVERLWVNPDCGLKTRGWLETRQALTNMVAAAHYLRTHDFAQQQSA